MIHVSRICCCKMLWTKMRRGESERQTKSRGGTEVCRGELRGIVYDKGEVDHHKRSQAEAGGAMASVIRGAKGWGEGRGARRRRRHGYIPLHGPQLLLSQHACTQWFTVTGVHLQDPQRPCCAKIQTELKTKEQNVVNVNILLRKLIIWVQYVYEGFFL